MEKRIRGSHGEITTGASEPNRPTPEPHWKMIATTPKAAATKMTFSKIDCTGITMDRNMTSSRKANPSTKTKGAALSVHGVAEIHGARRNAGNIGLGFPAGTRIREDPVPNEVHVPLRRFPVPGKRDPDEAQITRTVHHCLKGSEL